MLFCCKKTVLVVASLLLCSVGSLSAADNPSSDRAAWIRSMNEQVRAKAKADAGEAAAWERANHGVYEGGGAYDAMRGALYFQGKAAEAAGRGDERSAGYYTMLADESCEIAQFNLERSKREGNTYDVERYNQLIQELKSSQELESSSSFSSLIIIAVLILSAAGFGVFYYLKKKRSSMEAIDQKDGNASHQSPVETLAPLFAITQAGEEGQQYYICKTGCTQEGPYPEDMVLTCYKQGIFPVDTLIWYEGAAEWMLIQNVFPTIPDTPDSPPVNQTPLPMPQESAAYFLAQPGMQPQGPYTKSAILSGYYQGVYPAGSMVWGPETASWIPITALPQFAATPVQGGNAIRRQFQTWGKAKDWNPVNAFVSCMKRYAQFSGRASRPEYWYCQLAFFILLLLVGVGRVALAACDAEVVGMLLDLIVRLAIIVPMFALAVRRCHDTGRCGWYILIPIYGWVIFFLPSKNGNNQYGSAPLPPA